MRRIALILTLLLLAVTLPALGHGLNLVATIELQGNQVTVTVIDVYGSPAEGLPVSAATGLLGQPPGRFMKLTEIKPGVYQGAVAPLTQSEYALTVEAQGNQEILRGSVPANPGEAIKLVVGLQHYQQGWFTWDMGLFAAACVLLLGATFVAMRRQRRTR
jgi:hypothetical protein